MVGQNVGKYKVLDRIGRGGMGTVYRAIDETLHRDVAIKVLNAELGEPEIAKRFRAEAITVARLNHPGIAAIYELLQHDGQWLMVMEFVRGETLEHLIERMGPLSAQRAAEICMQALAALTHAHSLGVTHRDLKPANLMCTESGAVKIMDFGIARVAGAEHLTSAGYMMGTPAYMAPEQVLGLEVDARADLYAMGVVFYRLLTGKLPFKGETPFALAQSQVHDPPTPAGTLRSDLPPWVEQFLARALAKSPGERFQSAVEMHEAFARCLAGLPLISMYDPAAPTEQIMTPPRLPTGSFATRPPTGAHAYSGQPTPMSTAPTVVAGSTPMGGNTAPPAPAPAAAKQTNLTIAVLAATVVILAVVVGIVLFRPAPGGTVPPPAETATQPAVPPADIQSATSQPQPDTSSTPPPPATPPVAAPATPPPAPVTPPTSTQTSGRTSSPVQAGQTGQTTGTKPPAASSALNPAAGSPGATPPVTVPPPAAPPPAAPTVTSQPSAPVTAPVPAPATEEHVTFSNLKVLLISGKRTTDQDVILTLAGGQLSVSPRTGGSPMAAFPYKSVARATYIRAKDPKWDSALPAPPDDLDMPGGLFGRPTRHWLTLQTKQAFLVLRLEDSNVKGVLDAVEARTGIKIAR
jgi:serine/threonine-protein kinase